MDLQTLTNILVAAISAHGLHSLGEPRSVQVKLKRLVAYMDKQTPPKIPQGIDTPFKAVGSHYLLTIILFAVALLITNLVDPSVRSAMWFSIIVLAGVELLNTVAFNNYHIAIEKVTRRFKNEKIK